MKKLLTTLMAATCLINVANARFFDTKAQSDARYGKPTRIYADSNGIEHRIHLTGTWNIETMYDENGRCVFLEYSHRDGTFLSSDEIAQLLDVNSQGYIWQNYANNQWGINNVLFAKYFASEQSFADGRKRMQPAFRITNRATLEALGFMEKTVNVEQADI